MTWDYSEQRTEVDALKMVGSQSCSSWLRFMSTKRLISDYF